MFHNARLSSRHDTVLHNVPLQFSSLGCVPQYTVEFTSCTLCSTMHRCISRHARSVTQCTVADLVMYGVFHNALLSCRHARCVPRRTVEFSSCMLCSTMHGLVFVPKCMVAVLVMHAVFHNARLSSRHARCVPRSTVEFSFHITLLQFSSCTMCSTMRG